MSLTIRNIAPRDCAIIAKAFEQQGWLKPVERYKRLLAEASDGLRHVLIAQLNDEFAGYLNILWISRYAPFRERSIPEITDLNVLIKFRRNGVATRLLDAAESLIEQRSEIAGIRVGLTPDYTSAHRLYIRRGYVPDGFGLSYEGQPLQYGETATVDDDLTLGFTKRVRQ